MVDFLLEAVSAAVATRQITPQAGYLWCVLRTLAGVDATPEIFSPPVIAPSDADLQRALGGCSRTQVFNLLRELMQAGLVRKTGQGGRRPLQLVTPAGSPELTSRNCSPELTSPARYTGMHAAARPPGNGAGEGSAGLTGPSPNAVIPTTPSTAEPSAVICVSPAPVVDYHRLTDVQPAPDPQREAAQTLWARLLAQLPPATFANTLGLELAESSGGEAVLIVGVPNAGHARALDAGQSETLLQATLRAAGFPVRAVRFVGLAAR